MCVFCEVCRPKNSNNIVGLPVDGRDAEERASVAAVVAPTV